MLGLVIYLFYIWKVCPPLFILKNNMQATTNNTANDVSFANLNSSHHYGLKNLATPLLSKKKPNFQDISTPKHFINIFRTPTNQFINSKYPKKNSKNMKSNWVKFIFLKISLFSSNIAGLNNHYQVSLISCNT